MKYNKTVLLYGVSYTNEMSKNYSKTNVLLLLFDTE